MEGYRLRISQRPLDPEFAVRSCSASLFAAELTGPAVGWKAGVTCTIIRGAIRPLLRVWIIVPASVVLQPSSDTLSEDALEAQICYRAATINVAARCHIAKVLIILRPEVVVLVGCGSGAPAP